MFNAVYKIFMVPVTDLKCFLHTLDQRMPNRWRRGGSDEEALVAAGNGVCHGQAGITAQTIGQKIAVFLGLLCCFHVLFTVDESHIIAFLAAENKCGHWFDGTGCFFIDLLLPKETVIAVSQTLPLAFRQVNSLCFIA